ncbi:MAG: addiction module protein [Rhodocyclaceae bacterium]|nr:addiction module protein [Rhodocyclaceae bacterium]
MSALSDELAKQAKILPTGERAQLAQDLLLSVARDAEPAFLAEWDAEAERREASIARGEAAWIAGPQAVARLRAKLAAHLG